MNSTESPQQPSEESLTFTIRRSSQNTFFAKILILLGLTLLGGHFFAKLGAQEYEQDRELTKEKYLADFD